MNEIKTGTVKINADEFDNPLSLKELEEAEYQANLIIEYKHEVDTSYGEIQLAETFLKLFKHWKKDNE